MKIAEMNEAVDNGGLAFTYGFPDREEITGVRPVCPHVSHRIELLLYVVCGYSRTSPRISPRPFLSNQGSEALLAANTVKPVSATDIVLLLSRSK